MLIPVTSREFVGRLLLVGPWAAGSVWAAGVLMPGGGTAVLVLTGTLVAVLVAADQMPSSPPPRWGVWPSVAMAFLLAAACVVAAVVRGDALAAGPAVLLLGGAPLAWRLRETPASV